MGQSIVLREITAEVSLRSRQKANQNFFLQQYEERIKSRGAKRVYKMAMRKSDEDFLQHDNKLRIWTRSVNSKSENRKLSLSGWQRTTRTPMTTSTIAWHRTMHSPLTTSTERERAFPLVCQRSVVSHHSQTHRGSSSMFAPSHHLHVHGHLWVLFTLSLSVSSSTFRPFSSSSSTWSLW